MRKTRDEAPVLDIDGIRARVAEGVGMAVSALIGPVRDDAHVILLRRVAAYFLYAHDHLAVGDIETVMDKGEHWVRYATGYIERRISHYYAFKAYVEQTMATYALASK